MDLNDKTMASFLENMDPWGYNKMWQKNEINFFEMRYILFNFCTSVPSFEVVVLLKCSFTVVIFIRYPIWWPCCYVWIWLNSVTDRDTVAIRELNHFPWNVWDWTRNISYWWRTLQKSVRIGCCLVSNFRAKVTTNQNYLRTFARKFSTR